MKTSSIERMYRHLNLLDANGQSGGAETAMGEPENLPDRECSEKNFVFVHGYNVNPLQARGWFAEMFKRMWHSGSRAKFTGVTWYGYETQGMLIPDFTPDFQANILNAFASADAFTARLKALKGPITVAGHSLANILIGSAIEDWGVSAENYFMIDAAVAKECYKESEEQTYIMSHPWWENYDNILRATEWHRLPWPDGDWRARLTWKNRLRGVVNGVVNSVNFYSSGEEVLRNPSHGNTSLPNSALGVWAAQEKRKGYGLSGYVLTSAYGGWNINPHPDYAQVVNEPFVGPQAVSMTQSQLTSLYGPSNSAAFQAKLMSNPFFSTGINPLTGDVIPDAPGDIANLYGPTGSDYASPGKNRNRLLAEMVPARSTAAGSNPIDGVPSYDMNDNQNDWPASRPDRLWRHSDLRQVSYTFTCKVFDEFVNRVNLNK